MGEYKLHQAFAAGLLVPPARALAVEQVCVPLHNYIS